MKKERLLKPVEARGRCESAKKKHGKPQVKPEWVNTNVASERGIPDYFKANKNKPVVGPIQLEAEDLERGKRLQSSGDMRKVTFQTLENRNSTVELNTIKRILQREELMAQVKGLAEEYPKSKKQLFHLLFELGRMSIQVVEAIEKWKSLVGTDESFYYDQRNYLMKMMSDTSSLNISDSALEGFAQFRGYVDGKFTVKRNPFLESVPVPKYISTAVSQSSHLSNRAVEEHPMSWELRWKRALNTLLLEELKNKRTKSRGGEEEFCNDDKLDQPQLLEESKVEEIKVSNSPKQREDNVEKSGGLEKGDLEMVSRLGLEEEKAEEEVSRLVQEMKENEATRGTNRLPPLSKSDMRLLGKNGESKLERMEKEIVVSQEIVSTLEIALEQVDRAIQGRLKRLTSAQRERKDIRQRTVGDLERKRMDFAKKLKYRKMDLNSKKLARDILIQNRINAINHQIENEIFEERKEYAKAKVRANPGKKKQTRKERREAEERMFAVHKFAQITVMSYLNSGVQNVCQVEKVKRQEFVDSVVSMEQGQVRMEYEDWKNSQKAEAEQMLMAQKQKMLEEHAVALVAISIKATAEATMSCLTDMAIRNVARLRLSQATGDESFTSNWVRQAIDGGIKRRTSAGIISIGPDAFDARLFSENAINEVLSHLEPLKNIQ